MSHIQGPSPVSGPQGISSRIENGSGIEKSNRTGSKDRVEISELAQWKAKLAKLPSIREDLVGEVKAEIEAGRYETEEKVRGAVEKLYADLKEEGSV